MQTVRRPPARRLAGQAGTGLIAGLLLLAVLAGTVGMGGPGWAVGVAFLLGLTGLLVVAVARSGRDRLGPADAVTLTRAVLVGALTALVADSIGDPAATPVPVLVALASVALVLDAVDGRVARRTGTVTAVGARFDMEVDAVLVLVLALYDVRLLGGWVLLIGLARYLLLAAGWVWPWLTAPTPPRRWNKVVAAVQGIVLTVVMADLLPRPVAVVLTAGALALLAESFGRQVWWLVRHARQPDMTTDRAQHRPRHRSRHRRLLAALVTAGAVALVWFALVGPADGVRPADLARIPVEAVVGVALLLLLPPRLARPLALVAGVVLAGLALIRLLDLGFLAALDRPFNPVSDWAYAASFLELLGGTVGRTAATGIGVAIVAVALGVVVAMPLAVRRLTGLAGRRPAVTARFLAAFGAIWLLAATTGLQVAPGTGLAAADAAGLAAREAALVRTNLADRAAFADELAAPVPVAHTGSAPLAALAGKDVLVVFVESYGRVAVEDPQIGPGVSAVLDDGSARLAAAGFTARSAFLTSPTFGGISWLAHSTLESGLWVDSQQRYDQLMATGRPTLISTFGDAGWRTVLDVPANRRDWPEASTFYRAEQVYDGRSTDYAGPGFGFATIPDQYTLAFLQRAELAPQPRRPVFAEIDLQTSHTPWLPLPELVDWSTIGDGSVYAGQPERSPAVDDVWSDATAVRAAYGRTIEYSLSALISFVLTYGTDDLVVLALGDHQPASVVSGEGAGHDVPVTVISRDPAVAAATAGWGWPAGLHPAPDAPVWRMDALHHRFLDAFAG
ncbi:CDP-alcohol phosphatidyltransferase family protein [Nakamurella sp.]|uniref:CDP-alcohol phosphatidyltransferase family protein n=1 Tax=Nakamurella sp. TaxID=1869182 RepID=UPI003B3B5C6F